MTVHQSSSSSDRLAALQAHVAGLRRKLLEERAEQDRARHAARVAQCEATHLGSELQAGDFELIAERDRLKERSMEAKCDQLAVESYKKEVAERRLQIAAFEADLELVTEEADRKVSAGIKRGIEAIERREKAHLAAIESQRAILRSRLDTAEAELEKAKERLTGEKADAAKLVHRSSAVQVCAILEQCTQRCELAEEQEHAKELVEEVHQQREEQRRQRDVQLEEVSQRLERAREATAERRKADGKKVEKRRKAWRAKIAQVREELEELEEEAAEHAREILKRQVKQQSATLSLPSLPKVPAPTVAASQPKRFASASALLATKAGDVHAEFPLLGLLQQIDNEIRTCGSSL